MNNYIFYAAHLLIVIHKLNRIREIVKWSLYKSIFGFIKSLLWNMMYYVIDQKDWWIISDKNECFKKKFR